MQPVFQYRESWALRLGTPVVVFGVGLAVAALFRNWWQVGLILAILGLGGCFYGVLKAARFLIISDEEVRSNEGTILVNQIEKVCRKDVNEAVYYEFQVKDKGGLLVKAPYPPSQEKQAWALLEELNYKFPGK